MHILHQLIAWKGKKPQEVLSTCFQDERLNHKCLAYTNIPKD